jgi:lysyl-tRNA synthetase class 2
VLIALVLSAGAILKGKRLTGLVGLFVPLISFVGLCRLATPSSPWSRRFYAHHADKLARSRERYARISARRKRLSDAIAGAPSE